MDPHDKLQDREIESEKTGSHEQSSTADGYWVSVAEALDRAAEQARRVAADLPGGPPAEEISLALGRRLEDTASYLRRRTSTEMQADVTRTIRRNPTASIAVAAIAGLLVGLSLRR